MFPTYDQSRGQFTYSGHEVEFYPYDKDRMRVLVYVEGGTSPVFDAYCFQISEGLGLAKAHVDAA